MYLFLRGLDDEFESIRGEVLRKDPPFSLQVACRYVCRNLDRKSATLADGLEDAALTIHN